MPLSDDQRALLRLLVSGDDYEQIAGVLGTDDADVRRRAREAIAALEGEPGEEDFAQQVRGRLDALESGERMAAPAPAQPGPRRRLWLGIAGVAMAVLVAVFVVTQLGDDGGGSAANQPDVQEDVVSVDLIPVGGSKASGAVRIVRVADRPAVDLDIQGLTPSAPGQSYVIALEDDTGKSLPLAFRAVGADGKFTGRTQIPVAASGLLPSFDFIVVSLATDQEAAAAVQQAANTRQLPERIGQPVLRGALRG